MLPSKHNDLKKHFKKKEEKEGKQVFTIIIKEFSHKKSKTTSFLNQLPR